MYKLRMIALSATAMAIFAGPAAAATAPPPGKCGTAPSPPNVEVNCATSLSGNYENPNDCCSYIACSNGLKYYMPCPSGLHWDRHSAPPSPGPPVIDNNGQCNWAHLAGCEL